VPALVKSLSIAWEVRFEILINEIVEYGAPVNSIDALKNNLLTSCNYKPRHFEIPDSNFQISRAKAAQGVEFSRHQHTRQPFAFLFASPSLSSNESGAVISRLLTHRPHQT
jgi:hypothetical protein